jgi:hypothetical protein
MEIGWMESEPRVWGQFRLSSEMLNRVMIIKYNGKLELPHRNLLLIEQKFSVVKFSTLSIVLEMPWIASNWSQNPLEEITKN